VGNGGTEQEESLAAEVLQSYRELRLRVTGPSMLPAIWPGDILSIHPCGVAEAGLGDILLFTRDGRLFAHRVVSRSGECLVTRGDGVPDLDPPVKPGELIGRVFEIVRGRKRLRPKRKLSLGGRIAAVLASRSASASRILARLHGLPGGAGS
jgi:phage repressor protein C with HTH and peptisase S24 domain